MKAQRTESCWLDDLTRVERHDAWTAWWHEKHAMGEPTMDYPAWEQMERDIARALAGDSNSTGGEA